MTLPSVQHVELHTHPWEEFMDKGGWDMTRWKKKREVEQNELPDGYFEQVLKAFEKYSDEGMLSKGVRIAFSCIKIIFLALLVGEIVLWLTSSMSGIVFNWLFFGTSILFGVAYIVTYCHWMRQKKRSMQGHDLFARYERLYDVLAGLDITERFQIERLENTLLSNLKEDHDELSSMAHVFFQLLAFLPGAVIVAGFIKLTDQAIDFGMFMKLLFLPCMCILIFFSLYVVFCVFPEILPSGRTHIRKVFAKELDGLLTSKIIENRHCVTGQPSVGERISDDGALVPSVSICGIHDTSCEKLER